LKKFIRYFLLIFFVFSIISCFILFYFVIFPLDIYDILKDWTFYPAVFFLLLITNEIYHWAKIGKRSELSDIAALLFFMFLIFFITKDFLTSIVGAFSIYLWFGAYELREYSVINKILIISLVTYNVIFVAGLISFYLKNPFYLNTAFAFSFWIILGLGFILFGRKYIIVWRFMSPAYLLLFLYVIAWIIIVFINQYTPIKFIYTSPFTSKNFSLIDFFLNIYFVLIVVNWIVYFASGVILDKLLGIKQIKENKHFLSVVEDVKNKIGIKSKVKVGFGKYPILNAMAYGPFFDKRIAIISEDINQIPDDELKGIVAHELAHTKGHHTLILTLITTGDLIFRMLLGLPATYYDYTFGNPQIPMIAFIFLNLAIYFLLFIFVRILEGKADLKAKNAGYARELAKALYNLESFYATGREFGLNTMLLSDEKISKDNQLLDYIETAEYLYRSTINPSRASLLSNLMNSHPPTYFRIIAILSNELKPLKEAFLPFLLLKRSKQRKFAQKFENARYMFKSIANEKFEEMFKVKDLSILLNSFNKNSIYETELNHDFLFRNKISDEIIIGTLIKIQFINDLCDSDQYVIKELRTNKQLTLNVSQYSKRTISLNERYYFKKKPFLTLKDIELNEDIKNGNYVFEDDKNNKILKEIIKIKLPNSIDLINTFKDKDIFFKIKGELKIYKCIDVIFNSNIANFEFKFETEDKKQIEFKLKELIIRPKNIYLNVSSNTKYRQTELRLIEWLIKNNLRAYFHLKKPVNNLEIGYVQNVLLNLKKIKKSLDNFDSDDENFLNIINIFGKLIKIPYKQLELINFDYETAMMQKKSETSIFSRFGYKLLKKINPQKVIMI